MRSQGQVLKNSYNWPYLRSEVTGSCQVKGQIEVSRSNGLVCVKMTTAGCSGHLKVENF